jgi:hypothetical protein
MVSADADDAAITTANIEMILSIGPDPYNDSTLEIWAAD